MLPFSGLLSPHWFTFMFSCMSINMLMMAWEHEGVEGMEERGQSGAEEQRRVSLSCCEIAFVCPMNGLSGAALSARCHAALTSEHS